MQIAQCWEWERKWTGKMKFSECTSQVDFRQSIQYSLWIKTRPQSSRRPCKMAQVSHHQLHVRLQGKQEVPNSSQGHWGGLYLKVVLANCWLKVPVIFRNTGLYSKFPKWFPTTCMSRVIRWYPEVVGICRVMKRLGSSSSRLTHYTSDLLLIGNLIDQD